MLGDLFSILHRPSSLTPAPHNMHQNATACNQSAPPHHWTSSLRYPGPPGLDVRLVLLSPLRPITPSFPHLPQTPPSAHKTSQNVTSAQMLPFAPSPWLRHG